MILKTVVLYIAMILAVRILGKRQIGQLEPSEFVVTMVIAELATLPMQGKPLTEGLLPMAVVLVLEMTCAFLSMRSIGFRKLLCGKPVILVENGKMLQDNMRKTRVTIDELSGHLREKDVLDLSTVRYAILETNGNLSVFLKGDGSLPVTVVSDGKVLQDNLHLLGKDLDWLTGRLQRRKVKPEQVWLFTVDQDGKENLLKKND